MLFRSGDGIIDGEEREDWSGPLEINRWQKNVRGDGTSLSLMARHAVIYGNPTDKGTYCIRGGGLSPTTIDTDRDGLPDAWEDEHGLDKSASADGKLYTLDDNYTNLEVYLNSLVQDLY